MNTTHSISKDSPKETAGEIPAGKLVQCFPIPVFNVTLSGHKTLNTQLVKEFYEYRDKDKSKGSQWQRCEAYSSDTNILEKINSPSTFQLSNAIYSYVQKTVTEVNKEIWQRKKIKSVSIVNSEWFQIYNNYGHHDLHVHSMSSWSGIYYIQAGKATNETCDGRTRFYGPHVHSIYYEDAGNLYLRPSQFFDIRPTEGLLLVFPSYLPHQALPYNGDKDRIVVAFTTQVTSKS